MATNRERHMTGFPPAVYPFPFNPMRSHSPFDLLTNGLFGRFGADLPREMAALSHGKLRFRRRQGFQASRLRGPDDRRRRRKHRASGHVRNMKQAAAREKKSGRSFPYNRGGY